MKRTCPVMPYIQMAGLKGLGDNWIVQSRIEKLKVRAVVMRKVCADWNNAVDAVAVKVIGCWMLFCAMMEPRPV